MAKIFRISGYLVSEREFNSREGIKEFLNPTLDKYDTGFLDDGEMWQQLHVEESEAFELDGEDKENCDLALLTRHFKKDNSNMRFDRPLPVAGEKYKHFKLGKIVTVIGISRHTETEEITVVYEYEGTIWNRPLEMFMSEVDREKYKNVSQKYRFEKVESGVSITESKAIDILRAKLKCMKLELLACIEKGCDRKCDNCDYNYAQGNMGEQKEALSVAIQALEKQIPKKVKIEQWIYTKCDCGYEFSRHHGDGYYSIPLEKKTNYCPNCGQKLDWSDEE